MTPRQPAHLPTKRLNLSALLFASLACLCLPSQAQTPGEIWETTSSVEIPGIGSMPGINSQVCMPKGRVNEKAVQPDPRSECKMTSFNTIGNKSTFTMACKNGTGSGEIIHDGKSFQYNMKMQSQAEGINMNMSMRSKGTNTGKPCDAGEMQRKANEMVQQSKAVTAQYCNESAQRLESVTLFQGDNPACAAQKKQFCATAVRTINGMSLPTNFQKNAMKGVPLEDQPWAQASALCSGPQPATVLAQACVNGVKNKSWNMVVDFCPEDAEAQAQNLCTGRDYTSMDAATRNLCSRAMANTQSQESSSNSSNSNTSKRQPEMPKVDPVKEGAKLLKGLFGL